MTHSAPVQVASAKIGRIRQHRLDRPGYPVPSVPVTWPGPRQTRFRPFSFWPWPGEAL